MPKYSAWTPAYDRCNTRLVQRIDLNLYRPPEFILPRKNAKAITTTKTMKPPPASISTGSPGFMLNGQQGPITHRFRGGTQVFQQIFDRYGAGGTGRK
jgi:hypothetical protein